MKKDKTRITLEYHKWKKGILSPEEVDCIDEVIVNAMEKIGWRSCGRYHKCMENPGTELRGLDFEEK